VGWSIMLAIILQNKKTGEKTNLFGQKLIILTYRMKGI